jgi:hypothetical protein
MSRVRAPTFRARPVLRSDSFPDAEQGRCGDPLGRRVGQCGRAFVHSAAEAPDLFGELRGGALVASRTRGSRGRDAVKLVEERANERDLIAEACLGPRKVCLAKSQECSRRWLFFSAHSSVPRKSKSRAAARNAPVGAAAALRGDAMRDPSPRSAKAKGKVPTSRWAFGRNEWIVPRFRGPANRTRLGGQKRPRGSIVAGVGSRSIALTSARQDAYGTARPRSRGGRSPEPSARRSGSRGRGCRPPSRDSRA